MSSNNANTTRTDLVFVIDKSGSMSGLENSTIEGYNDMLTKQRKVPGKAKVTTVLFDEEMTTMADRVPLEDVRYMERGLYNPYGCTALLDAVGSTIKRVNAAQKADPAGRPENTVFVITTDGMENASSKYSFAKIKRMVEKRTAKNGWEFVFLGANIDAIAAAADLGIAADRAATYVHDEVGTGTVYAAASEAITRSRCGKEMSGWNASVNADFARRG